MTFRFAPVAACFLLGITGISAPVTAAPTDIVPRGDISYDLLASLAAAGKLPGYSVRDFARGDRLYTRREMAYIIAKARVSLLREGRNSRYAAAERALAIEFNEELRALRPEVDPSGVQDARTVLFTGQFKLRALTDPAAGDFIGRVGAIIPVGRDGYAALSGGSFREEWYANGRKAYPAVETAFLRVNGRMLDVTIGRQPLRWGPGYSGALLLSDESPSLPQIQVEKGFRLPGSVGKRLGRLYYTQVYGQFFEDDDPTAAPDARGTRRHFAARRLESQSAGRWNISFAEAFKSTRLPSPFFSAVLPFYLYQNEWSKTSRSHVLKPFVSGALPDTFWFNYTGDAQVSYRPGGRGDTLYADLLLDDVKSPKGIGLGNEVERRTGWQIGAYTPDLFGLKQRYGARLEYSTIDRTTYTDISRPINWSQNNLPLGYSAGPNAKALFGRFDARITEKLRAAVEGQTRRRRRSTSEASMEPNIDRVSLLATYELKRDLFVGTRLDRTRIAASASANGGTRTRFEANVGFGF